MSKRRHTAEQIIGKLREAEDLLDQDQSGRCDLHHPGRGRAAGLYRQQRLALPETAGRFSAGILHRHLGNRHAGLRRGDDGRPAA